MFVEVNDLWKRYSGNWALRGISLQVEQTQILGVFGENGGGKSTLFQLVCGILFPSKGEVSIQGHPVSWQTRKQVAYMPEVNPYPERMTILELVTFLQKFYSGWDLDKTAEMLRFMGLNFEQKVGELSKGQQARLRLICTFSWPSKLVVMDEPLAAVDPVSRKKILQTLFSEFKLNEQTVLLCSHLLTEVEDVVDEVAYLHKGEILISGAVGQLREQYGKSLLDIFEELVG